MDPEQGGNRQFVFGGESRSETPVLLLDEKSDRRLVRKLDWHLIPLVSMLYLCATLIRANIGNAHIFGLGTDLRLEGLEFNICVAMFAITYSLAQVPSNLALKQFRPSVWIPSITIACGVVMTFMAFVRNFDGLLTARLFLGLVEAGVFPGIAFYISMWYKRSELARRTALVSAAGTLAGAFGGLLAYGINYMNGLGGLRGWSWLFALEGSLTFLIAGVSYFFIYDGPETARFLSKDEAQAVRIRSTQDSSALNTQFDKRFIWQALGDWKSWMQVLIYMTILVALDAFVIFLPTIITSLGYNKTEAQLLSIPPYIIGCIAMLTVSVFSDKYKVRGPFLLAILPVAIVGYVVLCSVDPTRHPGVGYAATIVAACGLYPVVPLSISWAGNNAGGEVKRGVVLAMTIGIGNLGGIASAFLYRDSDMPQYRLGHAVVIGSLCASWILSLFAMLLYRRLNRQKDEKCENEKIFDTPERRMEYMNMGDASPLFRYTF